MRPPHDFADFESDGRLRWKMPWEPLNLSKQSFTADAWEECLVWQESDRKGPGRLDRLIEETRRTPHEGIGKPKERL